MLLFESQVNPGKCSAKTHTNEQKKIKVQSCFLLKFTDVPLENIKNYFF